MSAMRPELDRISDEAVFYLMSRGLSEEEAKSA